MKFTIKQLIGNAVYIGNRKMYRSNEMNRFLVGYRDDVCLINLSKTVYMLKRALRALELIVYKRGLVFFAGVDLQGPFELNFYSEIYSKYIWYGGSLTNYYLVYNYLGGLRFKSKSTTKINQKNNTYQNTGKKKKGLRRPSALILIGNTLNKYYILNEAVCYNIPSIALIDSDMFPHMALYSIVSCNKITGGIEFYSDLFKRAVFLGYLKGIYEFKKRLAKHLELQQPQVDKKYKRRKLKKKYNNIKLNRIISRPKLSYTTKPQFNYKQKKLIKFKKIKTKLKKKKYLLKKLNLNILIKLVKKINS